VIGREVRHLDQPALLLVVARAAHVHGDRPSFSIERRPERADPRRAIAVADAQVLFATPEEFHRPSVERLGDPQHLSDLQSAGCSPAAATAEPAADKYRMHIDVLGSNPGQLRYLGMGAVGNLIATPQLRAISGDDGGCVARLHAKM